MADIELIVKIDANVYTRLFDNGIQDNEITTDDICEMARALRLGTPLPKGHGELIDRNKIEYLKAIHDAKYGHISWSEATERIKYSAPTIIEAESEG